MSPASPDTSRVAPRRPYRASAWILAALAGGLVVGWLDRTATGVQGPLLLLMAAAFFTAIPRHAPAWAVALAAAAGLPLAHVAGHALGDATGASWGMLIAVLPATIAAYGGSAIGAAMQHASEQVDRRVLIGAVLVACTAVGMGPVYATLVARGQPFAWWAATIWQLVTLVAWAVATPALLAMWRRIHADSESGATRSEIATHAVIVAGLASAHSLVMPLVTRILFIPLGSSSMLGAARWALLAYVPLDALTYVAVCGAAYASDVDRRARAAATREAGVRGELAAAQLAGLRAQLRPHFLFNALNTASVLAARGNTDGTRGVLGALGEMLRYVIRGSDERHEHQTAAVPLRDEIAFVQQYLNIERERFAERLQATLDVAPDVESAPIPALLLQPLVENAIVHGVGGRIGAVHVQIRAWRDGENLRITVEDDGPGVASKPNAAGIGLTNTRNRLSLLYGSAASLALEPRVGGGAVARVTLPLRTPV